MRTVIQKIKVIVVTSLLLITGLLPNLLSATAYAAANGTCILVSNQGQKAQKVATCKSFIPSGTDSNGKKLDASKCYELDELRGSVNISKTVDCSSKELNSQAATCPDGTTAPDNDASKCSAGNGNGSNDSGSSNGTCVVGNESTCSVNSAQCNTPDNTNKTYVQHCTDPAASSQPCNADSCDLIKNYINPLITLLSALVGVAVAASIIVGGIQYSSSGGDPAKVTAAKNRIRNSIIAMVAFLFLYAFLQFLVPGGIFNR